MMIETYNSAGYRDVVDDFTLSHLSSPQHHVRFTSPSLPPSYPFISSYPPPLYTPYVPHSPALPKFPPPQFEIPDINLCTASEPPSFDYPSQFVLPPRPCNTFLTPSAVPPRHRSAMDPHMMVVSTPDSSTNTSPSRESAEEYSSDDSVPLAQLAMKRSAPDDTVDMAGLSQPKKPKTPKKRKKKDPNEPQKPVSGYALFFRDTQAAIKGQNPSASFGEVSKIVASMWDSLDDEHKSVYKKKTEMAKKEYLKQLAAYRASLILKGGDSPENTDKPSPQQAPQQQASYQQRVTVRHPPNMPPSLPILPPVSSPCAPRSPPTGYMDGYSSPPGPMMNMSPTGDYHMNQQVMGVTSDPVYGGAAMSPSMCIRNGCPNLAIANPGWDSEYCSNECVVNHCRDVFTAWVASRQMSPSHAFVK